MNDSERNNHSSDDRDDIMPVDESDDPLNSAAFWDKLRSFGTDDHEVLVSNFRTYTNTTLSDYGIKFFLEMANWNLQSAICAYYDYEQPSDYLPSMQLVEDITVGEGEAITPSTYFVKTWRIKNSGTEDWLPGITLRFLQGEITPLRKEILVGPLKAGEFIDLSAPMISPAESGIYRSQWRLHTQNGIPFGDIIWVIVCVEPGGLLGLTQQLENCHPLGTTSVNPNLSSNSFLNSVINPGTHTNLSPSNDSVFQTRSDELKDENWEMSEERKRSLTLPFLKNIIIKNHSSNQASDNFRLRSLNTFEVLDNIEAQHKLFNKVNKHNQVTFSSEITETDLNPAVPSNAVCDTAFKSAAPITTSSNENEEVKNIPFVRDPAKWTAYSLADVDSEQLSAAGNRRAALDFLSKLKENKITHEDDDDDGKRLSDKPLFTGVSKRRHCDDDEAPLSNILVSLPHLNEENEEDVLPKEEQSSDGNLFKTRIMKSRNYRHSHTDMNI